MLKIKLAAVLMATAFGAATLGADAITAGATPVTGMVPGIATTDTNLQSVAVVKKKKTVVRKKGKVTKRTTWVYSSGRHGPRYRYKRAGYGYYYGGYWYRRPWWTYGGPGINLCIGC
jgi:hypothetical protein